MVMVVWGRLWGGFYGALGIMSRSGVYVFAHGSYVVINALFGLFLAAATLVWRKKLTATTVNRNFLWSVWTAFALAAVWWPLSWWWELEFARAMTVNLVLYATVSWMAAAAVDMRIRFGSLAYLCGALLLGVVARFPWEVLAGSTVSAMFLMAWVWREPQAPTTKTS